MKEKVKYILQEIGAKGIGYHLWLSAFVFMFSGCIIGYMIDRKGG